MCDPGKARNRMESIHILEALSCLLGVTQYQVLSTLFQLAYHEHHPLKRFNRCPAWSVMERMEVPFTCLPDQRIYDSLYDRWGRPIDPLDKSNAYKLMRLLFLTPLLVPQQRNQLQIMLNKLNRRAKRPVNLEELLPVLARLKIGEVVCNVLERDLRPLWRKAPRGKCNPEPRSRYLPW
ncbi:uncharacterized protein [Drosophila kikkawai]|uniref:Uncharacterized protein n=1 Tax=Drosophila kikkawai TaxID=30033 RepID=A0ABM3C558_DROKI|nr:uncharacterized protein LOC121502118 [Drosophila kikkawai]